MSKRAYYFRCAVWTIVGVLFVALALGALVASVQAFSREILHVLAVDSTLRAPSTPYSKSARRSQSARGVALSVMAQPSLPTRRPVPVPMSGAGVCSGESNEAAGRSANAAGLRKISERA